MYLVSKRELELARMADKVSPSLALLHLTDTTTEVTDGKIAIRVTSERIPVSDYPIPDPPIPNGKAGPIDLKAEDALRLAKGITKHPVPALGCAVVGSDGEKVTGAVAHLPGWTRLEHADGETRFPNTEQVYPKGEPVASVGFNVELMASLCSALKRLGVRGVRLDLFGNCLGPMRITGRSAELYGPAKVEAVLMPMRSADWGEGK